MITISVAVKVLASVAVATLLGLVFGAVVSHKGQGRYSRRALLTPNEIDFFHRLRAALPEYDIFPQVAMHALLEPIASSADQRRRDFWHISQKIVDYVICDSACTVLALIELDDRTHNRHKDAIRDARVATSGLTTIRFESRFKPNQAELRDRVVGAISAACADRASNSRSQ
jgi:very-short-patch-repair endonuclease